MTLHVITSDFELKTYTLGNNEIKESHTAQTLRSYLIEMVNYWSLPGDNSLNDKLFQCIVVTVYYYLIDYCFLCNTTFFLLFILPYKLFIFLILTFYLNFDVKKKYFKFRLSRRLILQPNKLFSSSCKYRCCLYLYFN